MPDKTIKDQYGDKIVVGDYRYDGSVVLSAVEHGSAVPGEVTLVLSNKQRKKLRRALKRSAV